MEFNNVEHNKIEVTNYNGELTYTSYYNTKNSILSYYSYTIGLSMVNFDLSYINDLSSENSKTYIDKNLLVLSMLDDKMYFNKNTNKDSYQYNNILFINNEKDIIPLNLNIKDINSPLSIINNEIQMNIDKTSIIDKDNQLSAKYDTFNLANNNSKGLFKVDNNSLIISNNKLTLSYFTSNIIDNINENIDIMKNVINQCSYNLNKIITDFKEYQLYDQMYSCNINENHNIYYFDENKNNILMKNNYMYIDYYQKYFKIKINIIYNYLSSNIYDFNPFDEKYLKVLFDYQDSNESHVYMNNPKLDYKELVNNFIKINKDKSYIFNNEIIYFDENTNNIYGEVNYICYFDILNDELYNYLQEDYLKNIKSNLNYVSLNYIPFKIKFEYNDTKINISSSTECFLDLFIDRNYKTLQPHQFLYHDYSVGFNYNKIGNLVGICMITNILDKPIFMKYFSNENNYIVNRISNDILKDNSLSDIRCNNRYSGLNGTYNDGDHIKELSRITLIDNTNIAENKVLYKSFDITDEIDVWKNNGGNSINKFFDTKSIYKNYIKYAFNNTYNIYGNGLRKGDCYVPCLAELALFYFYGFYPYISYIEKKEFKNNEPKELDSSTLYLDSQNKIYLYSIDFSNINANVSIKKEIGLLKVNEKGDYISTGGKTLHRSISLFRLPDYSILFGKEYYLQFDEDINCESLEYITNGPIVLNIKLNNLKRTPIYTDFNFYYNDNTILLSNIKLTKNSESLYQLSFSVNKYSKNYNEIDIYYKDSDNSLNDYIINTINYRRLCKLSIKIK